MAHNTTEADMPWLELPGGFVFKLEAISPTTGAAITGVTVADIAIYGTDLAIGPLETYTLPYSLADDGGGGQSGGGVV